MGRGHPYQSMLRQRRPTSELGRVRQLEVGFLQVIVMIPSPSSGVWACSEAPSTASRIGFQNSALGCRRRPFTGVPSLRARHAWGPLNFEEGWCFSIKSIIRMWDLNGSFVEATWESKRLLVHVPWALYLIRVISITLVRSRINIGGAILLTSAGCP